MVTILNIKVRMARKHQLQKILKKSRPYMHDRINHLKEFIE